MVASAVGTALGIAAGAKVVEKLCDEIFESGKDFFKQQKIKKINKLAFRTIYRKIQSVENVKTIWKVDDEVNLREFYYPSKIQIPSSKKVLTASKVSDVSIKTNIIIEGTAGQGKSILLRYLASNEMKDGSRIPIFIELRRIKNDETIIDAITKKLDSLGFIANDNTVDQFLSSGKILLLLDGFDEVNTKTTTALIEDIELLSEKHESAQIVITSRPGSGIQNSGAFRVVQTAPILPKDHFKFLEKICSSKEQAKHIEEGIQNSSPQIKTLLRTPLLLTLLAILYKSEESIPENLIEFYDKLFYILYTRHDSTKPGFKREIKSGLTERKFEEVFEAFCFLSRKSQKVSLTRREATTFSGEALKVTKKDCDESDFINDCCKVACMLIEEGMDYHFIHKSVQEFYCARFISRRSDDFVKRFYDHALENFPEWQQEVNFLETLDKIRATRYFKIPAINFIKNEIEKNGPKYILEANTYTINTEGQIESLMTSSANSLMLYYNKDFFDHGLDNPLIDFMSENQDLPKEIFEKAKQFQKAQHSGLRVRTEPRKDSFDIDAYDLLQLANETKRIDEIVSLTHEILDEDMNKAETVLRHEEQLKELSF